MRIFPPGIILLLAMFSSCRQQAEKTANPGEFPPGWSEGMVWYQIFPERFSNGDTNNDPVLTDQKGCWPHELIQPWEVHPWESDWYEMQEYEKANQKDIWYNITRRRYGGDLQGIIDKLDYLEELGVGAIYLNPVFVSPSHHKYDIASYHHIEPTFGPDPVGDRKIMAGEDPTDPATWQWTAADSLMLKLIHEVHARDMKIILDGVFNHAGYNFFAFQDILEKQQKSEFTDWFTIYSWETDTSEFDYKGWWGVKDMPEFREVEGGLAEGPEKYIFNITCRWMDPEGNGDLSKGIDGWRLDVADQVNLGFWEKWRGLVKSINPEAYLTGEVTGSIELIKNYVGRNAFDAVMNYNFSFISSEYFIHPDSFSTSEFDSALRQLRDAFPYNISLAMQNLLGSHDTDRPLSRIHNDQLPSYLDKDNFFDLTTARNPNYQTAKPDGEAYRIFRLMALFQMTYPGAPMIYYGDEAGMWGAKDPGCRKPMLWPGIDYRKENYLPSGERIAGANPVEADTGLRNYYKKLIEIRNNNIALRKGYFKTLLTDNKNKIYGFLRYHEKDSLLIVLNNSGQKKTVRLEGFSQAIYVDLLTGKALQTDGKKLIFTMDPKSGSIISKSTSGHSREEN